ncbi:MAG: ComF family protein [Sulfuricaulis sp.]|uniref:ComF family protein n=1 Tax=Sulfuricaulis sp. TaxID=2003553 RepID=UPI003C632EFF
MVDISLGNIHRGLWSGNCLLCAARAPAGKDLCPACERSLPRTESACPRCAAHGTAMEIEGVSCGACQTHPPAYTSARAAFRYATPVDKLIQDLKYHDRLELSRLLGGYLANHLQALIDPLPDVVVPVPLHSSRLRERGYNQSLEIARFVAQSLELPINWKDAQRIRPTIPQTELPREQRRKNVRGAFMTGGAFAGRRVAIVDDVMTSGHTANALAESLLRSGAVEVRVWVVARA